MQLRCSGSCFLLLAFASIAFSAPPNLQFTSGSGYPEILNDTDILATFPGNSPTSSPSGENSDRFNVDGTKPLIFMVINDKHGNDIDQTVMKDTIMGARILAQQISDAYPPDDQTLKESFVFRTSDDAKAHFNMEPNISQQMTWKDVIEVCGDEGLQRYLDITLRWREVDFGLEEDGARKQLGHGALRPGPGDQPSTPIPVKPKIILSAGVGFS